MKIHVIPKFSIEPNKISLYNEVKRSSQLSKYPDTHENYVEKKIKKSVTEVTEIAIIRKTHNLELSNNAFRTLKKRINWLYYLSKSKSVKTYSGKSIYNFKMCFLTLTFAIQTKGTHQNGNKYLLQSIINRITSAY